VGLSQNRVSEIIGNANFGNIDTLLSQGHNMEYIARHYNMTLRTFHDFVRIFLALLHVKCNSVQIALEKKDLKVETNSGKEEI